MASLGHNELTRNSQRKQVSDIHALIGGAEYSGLSTKLEADELVD